MRHKPSKTVFCYLKKIVYMKSFHSLPVSLQSIVKSWKYLKMLISFVFALVPSSLNSATRLSRMRSLVGLKLILPSTKRGSKISLLLRTSSRRQNDSKPILSWSSIGMIVWNSVMTMGLKKWKICFFSYQKDMLLHLGYLLFLSCTNYTVANCWSLLQLMDRKWDKFCNIEMLRLGRKETLAVPNFTKETICFYRNYDFITTSCNKILSRDINI